MSSKTKENYRKPLRPFLTGTGSIQNPKTFLSSNTDSNSNSAAKVVLSNSLPVIQQKSNRKSNQNQIRSVPVNTKTISKNENSTKRTNKIHNKSTVPVCRKQESRLNSQSVDRSDTFTKSVNAILGNKPNKSQSLWHIRNHSHQTSVWRKFSSISNQIVPKNIVPTFTTENNADHTTKNDNIQTNHAEIEKLNPEWNNVRPRSFSFSTLNNLELIEKEFSTNSRPSSVERTQQQCCQLKETFRNNHSLSSNTVTSAKCDVQTSPTPPSLPRLEKTKSMTSVGTQVELSSRSELQSCRKSLSNHENVSSEPDWEFEYDPTTGRLVKRVIQNVTKKRNFSPNSNHISMMSSRYSSGFSDFNACQRCKGSNCCATIHSLSSRKSSLTHNEFDEFYNSDSQTSLNHAIHPKVVSTSRDIPPVIAQSILDAPTNTGNSAHSNSYENSKIRKPSSVEVESHRLLEENNFYKPKIEPTSSDPLQTQNILTSTLSPTCEPQKSRKNSIATQYENNRFEALLRNDDFLHNATQQAKTLEILSRKVSTFEQIKGVQTGPVQVISDHSQGVNCLELSEDRSLLVSGGEDAIVRLWSTLSTPCECIGVLVGHLSYITCATVYKLLVISGSADCTLKLWSIEDGNCLMTLKGHSAFINRITCMGPLLMSSSFDSTVRVWVLNDALTILKHDNGKESETISTDKNNNNNQDMNKRTLLERKTINYAFGSHLLTLEGHQKSVTQVALVPNEIALLESGVLQELDLVVTTSTDGTARTWALTSGEERHILLGHNGPINCLVTDPNEGQIIYTAGSDAVIKCWDIVTGEHLRDLKGHQNAVLCLISNNRILYSCSADHTVRAWAMEFGQCTRIYYRNTSAVTCCAYLRGILYTGSNDHCARIYDANSGVLLQTNSAHENAISAIAVVPGKLFTASFDGRILVWDVSAIQNEIASAETTINDHSTRLNKKKLFPKNAGLSSKIGATILNSTLDIFTQDYAQKLKNAPEKRTKSTLYPHLKSRSNSQAEVAAKKIIQKALKDKKSLILNRSSDSGRSSWIGTVCGQRLWSKKSESNNEKLVKKFEQINITKQRSNRTKDENFCAEIDPGVLALIEQQNHFNQMLNINVAQTEDSVNVQRAVTSLEPYLRSFK